MEISQHDPNSKPTRPAEPDFELYTIPSHSSWFRWDDIHETEQSALKDFFDGSSISRTPKIYKEYRDFIINKYREEPSRRLTFTHVRKSLVGDVSLLHKVFNFLDNWGLINFGAAVPSSEDNNVKTPQIRVEEGAPNGVRIVSSHNTVSTLRPIIIPLGGGEGGSAGENGGVKLPPLASYSDVFGGSMNLQDFKCGHCGEKCDSGRYKDIKDNHIICVKCFNNGNFGENKSMDDFKYTVTPGATWTETETLLLLEAVMKHGDDWDQVAKNVNTKSKLDCISKLIELPFGELMMGSANGKDSATSTSLSGGTHSVKQESAVSSEHQEITKKEAEDLVDEQIIETEQNGDTANEEPPSKRKRIASLSDAGSSLVKQVARIATMVGPHITAAAADAAVTAICDENSCPREIFDGDDEFLIGSSSPTKLYELERARTVEASEMKGKPVDSESKETSTEKGVPLSLNIKAATATALGSAAANAKLLADQEDREIEHLVATIIEAQMKKLQCKVQHFDELELIMEKEYTQMLEIKEDIVEQRIDALQKAFLAGVSKWKDRPV